MLIMDTGAKQHAQALDLAARNRQQHDMEVAAQMERDSITVAPDGQVDVTNPQAQMGRAMSSDLFIKKLKKLNPQLHFEVAINDHNLMGVYGPGENEYGTTTKAFICGMTHGWTPEFSIRLVETRQVPDGRGGYQEVRMLRKEVRGWRTVLARLIRAGRIGLSAAEKEFEINRGRDSQNWQIAVKK